MGTVRCLKAEQAIILIRFPTEPQEHKRKKQRIIPLLYFSSAIVFDMTILFAFNACFKVACVGTL